MFTGQFTDHARSLPDPDPRQSPILDLTLWIPDSRNWIPDPLSVEIWFRNPIVIGILYSKARDLGFHKKNFPGFRNTDYLTRWKMVDENRWRQKCCSSLIEVGWFRHALSAQLVKTKISELRKRKIQSNIPLAEFRLSIADHWAKLLFNWLLIGFIEPIFKSSESQLRKFTRTYN